MAVRETAHGAPGIPTNRIARSLQAITLGTIRGMNEREAMVEDIKAKESEQQFKIPIDGVARQAIQWAETDITFDDKFYPAHDRRDSTFTEPCFSFGYVSEADVMVSARVVRWEISGEGMVGGATVKVGVYLPGLDEEVKFKGEVHLVFQGYSAPTILYAE